MAGTLRVNDKGVIYRIDNYSGHYWPNDKEGYATMQNIAQEAFTRNGWSFSPNAWKSFKHPDR